MYKIAVVDQDQNWCLALKTFFQKSFDITIFENFPYSFYELVEYDLVFVNCSNFSAESYTENIHKLEIVHFIKKNFPRPPLLVIVLDFIDEQSLKLGKKFFPEAEDFFSKKADMEEILQQTQKLLSAKNQKRFEQSNQLIPGVKAMYTLAVVDDDKHWCFALERFFRGEFEVYSFPTASDFLKQSFDFDLVIVDYSIPHLDHEEYVESSALIRYLKNLRYPPLVILVSGYVSKNDSALGKNICPEADAFCAKDAGLDELSAKIKDLLACKR
ncbi:response regulator [Allocoleopsis franciscana]|uniref:Response regulator with CheY-like receiver domain and winged-helix DNA-binding domain n=1 Tax=Allocoleopsis franciscana PCC 7113 TaxID=1173027 RepID=K9WCT2_9CYAN|nr:response regulator [Allocoleopsis franciscana]AFZ18043.1 response regulator with CheY-like receiver domain and winged-helix DNA-binding domain [Allocoleopsis franciscana PCC 7113]